MSDTYDEFIKYLFNEYLSKKLDKRRINRHYFESGFDREIENLQRSMRAIRFIKDYARDDEDVLKIFTPEMIENLLRSVRYGVEINNDLVVDTEIIDILQDYFEEIVDGMTVDHFPQEDIDMLRQSGSIDPRQEIIALIHIIKSRKEQFLFRNNDNLRYSSRLEEIPERIEKIEKSFESRQRTNSTTEKKPAIKRAVFKGLGSIIQGTLLTIADITLMAGFWGVPLPTETTSVGAVVSITTGIGTIFTGIGDLRGE
jgi:hypothetical protein